MNEEGSLARQASLFGDILSASWNQNDFREAGCRTCVFGCMGIPIPEEVNTDSGNVNHGFRWEVNTNSQRERK